MNPSNITTTKSASSSVVTISAPIFKRAIELAKENAQSLRDSAGHSGMMGDYGASILFDKLEIVEYMWDRLPINVNRVPPLLKKFVEEAINESDSEYQEYLRLKSKFESKK